MNITLLTKEQISEPINFIKTNKKCKVSDFAVCLGAAINSEFCGKYYTSSYNKKGVAIVSATGQIEVADTFDRTIGIRPIISGVEIANLSLYKNESNITETSYGEYPQKIADDNIAKTLEELYNAKKIAKTNQVYTTDSRKLGETAKKFLGISNEEYEYNNKKYIRIKTNLVNNCTLENGKILTPNMNLWIEVMPLKWLIQKQNENVTMLSKEIVAAGIRYCDNKNYNGKFEKAELYSFLNNYFANEIVSKEKTLKK